MHRTLIAATLAVALGTPGIPVRAADSPALLPAVLTVHVKDFKYAPTPTTIHVGDRVTFVNDDDEAHTVTADDKSFDSEGLDSGATWQHMFTKPGTFHYFCELHPYMKATIVVLAASSGGR
jgi:plastocyanin